MYNRLKLLHDYLVAVEEFKAWDREWSGNPAVPYPPRIPAYNLDHALVLYLLNYYLADKDINLDE